MPIRITILPLIFSLILLSACAQPKIVIKQDKTIGSIPNTAIMINDTRPDSDKEYSIGSLLLFNDNYGIWTLGDDMFEPTVLDLLRRHINSEVSQWNTTPTSIEIKLNRLKFEANHQADMLASSSTQLGPLGVVIAEGMHGKEFETDLNKTKPFALGYIEADVKVTFGNKNTGTKKLSAYKAENFSSHMDVEGRMRAASEVLTLMFSSFASSMK